MAEFDMLVTGLRHWTATQDRHVAAATELLIWHESWLRRPDFARACLRPHGGAWLIAWLRARGFTDDGPPPACSSTELAVLRLATAIALDDYRLNSMGPAHAKAIMKTFALALGVDPAGLMATTLEVPRA